MKIHEKTKAGFLEKASTPFKLQGKYRGHLGKFRHRGAISRSAQLSGGLKQKSRGCSEGVRREHLCATNRSLCGDAETWHALQLNWWFLKRSLLKEKKKP